MIKGEAKPLNVTQRHFQLSASHSIKNIYDAIIELVTNSDDSYKKIGKKDGKILIEVEPRHKKSKLIIRDSAEGMTLSEMEQKLSYVGEKTSANTSRGFMGRGAKDICAIGNLTFESIKDGCLYKCQITENADFIPFNPKKGKNQKAVDSDYNRLGIKNGKNGMMVILETDRKMPRLDNLKKTIPLLYPLRDILDEKNGRPVLLRKSGDSKNEKLQYREPADAELVCDEEFIVEGYPNAKANFKLYQTKERIPSETFDKFKRNGIIIKGKNAIHEITFFDNKLESNDFNEYFYGRLECDYIDYLAEKYDECRRNKLPHPDENPIFIIDPQRRGGLSHEHPFIEKLFQLPKERLRKYLYEKQVSLAIKEKEIETKKTKKRLQELSKKLSKWIYKELEDPLASAYGQNDEYEGIIPTQCTLRLNEEKTFTLKLKKREDIDLDEVRAIVKCADKAIKVLTPEFFMSQNKVNEDIITGTFKIRGERKILASEIIVNYGDLGPFKTIIEVTDKPLSEIELKSLLEFEHKSYNVQEGKKRNLTIRCKYPDIVSEETPVIVSTNNDYIPIRGQCILVPVPSLGYAEGKVVVEGRKLHAQAMITAKVNGREATTNVKVGQIQAGFNFQTRLKDEYKGRRATWSPDIDSPKELHISVSHASVKRYLGVKKIDNGKETWEGQEELHFRTLLAEIASDAVCRLILERRAKYLDEVNITSVLTQYQKLMAEISPIAHEAMLSENELNKLK